MFHRESTKPLNIKLFYAILRASRQHPGTVPVGSVAFYFEPKIISEYQTLSPACQLACDNRGKQRRAAIAPGGPSCR
ncbi:MAG: hypothetical protein PVF07_12170, partial [Thiogranum sp.]